MTFRAITTAGVWILLLVLLALTVGLAFVPLGPGGTAVNLLIATLKAVLVMWFYMHLRASSATIRLFASAGLLWLVLLVALTLADNLTRTSPPAPW